MLTTNVERGRVKCHKYWPDVDELCEFEALTVTCVSETVSDNGSYVLRNFTLTHDDVSFVKLHCVLLNKVAVRLWSWLWNN